MKKTFLYILSVFILCFFQSNVTKVNAKSGTGQKGSRISVVVIDPGHGGMDPGAVVANAQEKDIVLDLALKLGKSIQLEFPDVKVIYTRSRDIFVPLIQRANIANKSNADLFISIHANYVDRKTVEGTETFVLGQHRSQENLEVAKKENAVILLEDDYTTTYEGFDPNSPESYIMFELVQDEYLDQSVMFASVIQNQFRTGAKRIDRSVKQAGFLVLRQTTMPSVLVEAGFLSHSTERNYLLSESGKSEIATSIFKAFKEYKKKIEDKSSFILVTTDPGEPQVSPVLISEEKIVEKPGEVQKVKTDNNNIYFSVQIAALQNSMETIPSNFKGEKEIFKIASGKIYRYYSGKHQTYEKALDEKTRLQKKFNDAFIVAFENDELISVKKAQGKM